MPPAGNFVLTNHDLSYLLKFPADAYFSSYAYPTTGTNSGDSSVDRGTPYVQILNLHPTATNVYTFLRAYVFPEVFTNPSTFLVVTKSNLIFTHGLTNCTTAQTFNSTNTPYPWTLYVSTNIWFEANQPYAVSGTSETGWPIWNVNLYIGQPTSSTYFITNCWQTTSYNGMFWFPHIAAYPINKTIDLSQFFTAKIIQFNNSSPVTYFSWYWQTRYPVYSSSYIETPVWIEPAELSLTTWDYASDAGTNDVPDFWDAGMNLGNQTLTNNGHVFYKVFYNAPYSVSAPTNNVFDVTPQAKFQITSLDVVGNTATVSGTGAASISSVTIQTTGDINLTWDSPTNVMSDSSGNFTATFHTVPYSYTTTNIQPAGINHGSDINFNPITWTNAAPVYSYQTQTRAFFRAKQ